MMKDVVLDIKDLEVSYEKETVLKKINFQVRRGEVFGIIGESGAGKSTLIKAISGDDQILIDSGYITYESRIVAGGNEVGIQPMIPGKEMGFIQQNPLGAFNPIRRYEVQFRELAKSHKEEFNKEKMSFLLENLGLTDTETILKKRPIEMSGGMCQRVAIAAAFYLEPQVLLCDEITSALDAQTAQAVMGELMELKKKMETTIIMVTHNLGIVRKFADKIAIMRDGQIIESGDKDEVFGSPKQEYTRLLIDCTPGLRVN